MKIGMDIAGGKVVYRIYLALVVRIDPVRKSPQLPVTAQHLHQQLLIPDKLNHTRTFQHFESVVLNFDAAHRAQQRHVTVERIHRYEVYVPSVMIEHQHSVLIETQLLAAVVTQAEVGFQLFINQQHSRANLPLALPAFDQAAARKSYHDTEDHYRQLKHVFAPGPATRFPGRGTPRLPGTRTRTTGTVSAAPAGRFSGGFFRGIRRRSFVCHNYLLFCLYASKSRIVSTVSRTSWTRKIAAPWRRHSQPRATVPASDSAGVASSTL